VCGACRFEGQEGEAILLLSRQHFVREQLQGLLGSCCQVTTDFENDIYGKVSSVGVSVRLCVICQGRLLMVFAGCSATLQGSS
jgi:hypothetical protein